MLKAQMKFTEVGMGSFEKTHPNVNIVSHTPPQAHQILTELSRPRRLHCKMRFQQDAKVDINTVCRSVSVALELFPQEYVLCMPNAITKQSVENSKMGSNWAISWNSAPNLDQHKMSCQNQIHRQYIFDDHVTGSQRSWEFFDYL